MWMATFGDSIDYNNDYLHIHIMFEIQYVIGMFIKLITDYQIPGEVEPVKDLEIIARNYY